MKNVKILVLTFFLAVTGYGYASGRVEASFDRVDATCCTTKAECCESGAECFKPGAPCCKVEMSCCEEDKECCNGDGGCLVKADPANGVSCAMCAGRCTEPAEADKTAAKTNAKRCCGPACTRTASAKK